MDIKVIGIDLGATNIRGAVVTGDTLSDIVSARIHSDGSVEDVLNDIYQVVDALVDDSVKAIGIGVPSVVDVKEGIVYDVLYIPSWKEVHLKQLMEERYHIPVFVNNDANCFAVGEYHFGKGKGVDSMIGLTLGTGLGAGVIINRKLYAGYNCGAGEFGLFDYKDNVLEYYASGSFFKNVYRLDGVQVQEPHNVGAAESELIPRRSLFDTDDEDEDEGDQVQQWRDDECRDPPARGRRRRGEKGDDRAT